MKNFLLEKTILPGQSRLESNEVFSLSSSVGFAAASIDGSYFGEEKIHLKLCLPITFLEHLFGSAFAQQAARTGRMRQARICREFFLLSTYRDPSPEKSLDTFLECISDAAHTLVKDDELCRMIAGTYGDELQPHSPRGRGNIGFLRTLDCIDEGDRVEKLKGILSVSPEQLKSAALSILGNAKSLKSVVICDKSRKSKKSTGVIIDLPL